MKRTRGYVLAASALMLWACKGNSGANGNAAANAPGEDAGLPVYDANTDTPEEIVLAPAPLVPNSPLGLPPLPPSPHNPTTAEKVALGRLLFAEVRLSGPGRTSCQTCHQPDHGFADTVARSNTAADKPNLRHTPSLLNTAYAQSWFWDGRMPTIEAALLLHWPGQLAADPDAQMRMLAADPLYAAHFKRAFSGPATASRVAEALASYVRTLRSGDSPWDRYEAGDRSAVSAQAITGFELFNGKAQCGLCHQPPLYSDFQFYALSVSQSGGPTDPGRGRVTGRPNHRGAFRTPSLRGLVATAPYFHDGSAPSLEATLDRKLSGLSPNVVLTPSERSDVLAFLRALSPE